MSSIVSRAAEEIRREKVELRFLFLNIYLFQVGKPILTPPACAATEWRRSRNVVGVAVPGLVKCRTHAPPLPHEPESWSTIFDGQVAELLDALRSFSNW